MELRDIDRKTKEVLKQCKNSLFKYSLLYLSICFFLLVGVMALAWFANVFLLGVFLIMPLRHGFIILSHKIVTHEKDSLSMDDLYHVFKKYSNIFSTYFIKDCFTFLFMLLTGFCMSVVVSLYFYFFLANSIQYDYSALNSYIIHMSLILLFCGIVMLILGGWLYSKYIFTFYILERFNITGVKALVNANELSKGYRGYLCKIFFVSVISVFGCFFATDLLITLVFPTFGIVYVLFMSILSVVLYVRFILVGMNLKVMVLFNCLLESRSMEVDSEDA